MHQQFKSCVSNFRLVYSRGRERDSITFSASIVKNGFEGGYRRMFWRLILSHAQWKSKRFRYLSSTAPPKIGEELTGFIAFDTIDLQCQVEVATMATNILIDTHEHHCIILGRAKLPWSVVRRAYVESLHCVRLACLLCASASSVCCTRSSTQAET